MQLGNTPFTLTGLFESVAYVPNHLLYLLSPTDNETLSRKQVFHVL